jgi:preprotein translocase subunit SecG
MIARLARLQNSPDHSIIRREGWRERKEVVGLQISSSLFIVQIILSVALVVLVLFQTKGGLGGLFGGEGSVFHRRRGVEKTLFQITIGLSVVFFLSALATALWV